MITDVPDVSGIKLVLTGEGLNIKSKTLEAILHIDKDTHLEFIVVVNKTESETYELIVSGLISLGGG